MTLRTGPRCRRVLLQVRYPSFRRELLRPRLRALGRTRLRIEGVILRLGFFGRWSPNYHCRNPVRGKLGALPLRDEFRGPTIWGESTDT